MAIAAMLYWYRLLHMHCTFQTLRIEEENNAYAGRPLHDRRGVSLPAAILIALAPPLPLASASFDSAIPTHCLGASTLNACRNTTRCASHALDPMDLASGADSLQANQCPPHRKTVACPK